MTSVHVKRLRHRLMNDSINSLARWYISPIGAFDERRNGAAASTSISQKKIYTVEI
jgi:hypothetical protein